MDNYHGDENSSQSISDSVVGKFGVGFVSVFMIADRIVISTQSEGDGPYHFSISDPKSPFIYSEKTLCNRKKSLIGTTVRGLPTNELYSGQRKN